MPFHERWNIREAHWLGKWHGTQADFAQPVHLDISTSVGARKPGLLGLYEQQNALDSHELVDGDGDLAAST